MFENGFIHRIVIKEEGKDNSLLEKIKKVIGLMKNELQKIITQLAATAPRAYSHEALKNNCELKTQIL